MRIKAGLSTAGRQAQEAERAASEAAGGSGKPRQRRLSLLLYFADAHWHTGEVDMWPQGQQSKVGKVGWQSAWVSSVAEVGLTTHQQSLGCLSQRLWGAATRLQPPQNSSCKQPACMLCSYACCNRVPCYCPATMRTSGLGPCTCCQAQRQQHQQQPAAAVRPARQQPGPSSTTWACGCRTGSSWCSCGSLWPRPSSRQHRGSGRQRGQRSTRQQWPLPASQCWNQSDT